MGKINPILLNKNTYNKSAQAYLEKYGDSWLEDKVHIDKFINRLPLNSTILDIGCGTGDTANYFKLRGLKITGIDISENIITIAKRRFPDIDFRVLDVHDVNSLKMSFDAVYSAYCLTYIPKHDLPKVLEKVRNILIPKGILFVSLIKGIGEKMIVEELKPTEKLYVSFFTLSEIKRYLTKARFSVFYESTVSIPQQGSSYDSFILVAAQVTD